MIEFLVRSWLYRSEGNRLVSHLPLPGFLATLVIDIRHGSLSSLDVAEDIQSTSPGLYLCSINLAPILPRRNPRRLLWHHRNRLQGRE